jgi:hypothetical protein
VPRLAGQRHDGGQDLELRLAEHTAVDLAHTVFEIDPITRFIEIGHFAILGRGNAQGACKLAYCVKHRLIFRSVTLLMLKYDFLGSFTNAWEAVQACSQCMASALTAVKLTK